MTTAETDSPLAHEASELLQLRYKARAFLWGHSALQRVRHCGRVAQSVAVPIMKFPGGHVQGSGLQHCMSVWACPVCSAQILAKRADTLGKVINGWRDRGGHIAMLTFTMSHDRTDSLTDLWDAVQDTWSRTWASSSWARLQEKFGTVIDARRETSGRAAWAAQRSHDESGNDRMLQAVDELTDLQVPESRFRRRIPMIRAIEVTWGPAAGWHVHVHALMLLRGDVDGESALSEIWLGDETTGAKGVLKRWQDRVRKIGRTADARAQEAHIVRGTATEAIADYLSKAVLDGSSIVGELARGDMKLARGANLTPWQMLAVAASGEHPEKTDQLVNLWRDYEKASRGRRQMVIPPGVLEYLGLGEFGTDEDAFNASDGRYSDWSPSEGCNETSPISNNEPRADYWRPAGPPQIVGVVSSTVWAREICRWDRLTQLQDAVNEGRLQQLYESLDLEVVTVPGSSVGLVDWIGPNIGVLGE